ncbi:DUF3103 family protein [Gallaecimonas sp. GXIMD4217]|uniref:DUF3103 family protein n=1 Tax=Gallaecimonas sp. GXIMD4217 TaxID=3131927 RepID=UPI00311B0DD5
MRKLLTLAALAALSTPALAANADRELALELAERLPAWQPRDANPDFAAPLGELVARHGLGNQVARLAERRDLATRAKRGLSQEMDQLLEVRLAHPAMGAALAEGKAPLVAYIPDGDEKQWSAIEAFAADGSSHMLDVHRLPERPVFVVGEDGRKAHRAGINLVRRSLKEAGYLAESQALASVEPLSATLIKQIRVNDDQEPWLLGKAEVFAVVAGVDPSRDEPQVDVVDMPYLDHDGSNYYPNQILVYWDRYRWGAADVVFFEQDANYNYQELVSLLLEVLGQALAVGGVPEALPFIGLGQKIVEAMPGNWFTNDDDYLDSFYTLEQNQLYRDYPGASGNVWLTLEPKTIEPSQ